VTRRRDAGQLTPLVAVGVAIGGFLAFGIARLGAGAADNARARTAADAAALAGAAAGEVEAARLAALNGGRLLSYDAGDGIIEVEVAVAGHTVTARARAISQERDGFAAPSPGKVGTDVHGRGATTSPP
jgi:hypothetical protein